MQHCTPTLPPPPLCPVGAGRTTLAHHFRPKLNKATQSQSHTHAHSHTQPHCIQSDGYPCDLEQDQILLPPAHRARVMTATAYRVAQTNASNLKYSECHRCWELSASAHEQVRSSHLTSGPAGVRSVRRVTNGVTRCLRSDPTTQRVRRRGVSVSPCLRVSMSACASASV